MRTSLMVLLAVFGAVALGYFLFFRAPSYTNYPPHTGPVIAFGDSLIAGTGATEDHDLPALLSDRIGEPVENFGIPGDTTADALARIDVAVARHPRMVILLLGGNDYLQRVPEEDTFKNLSAIIDRFQQDGALVVLLGVRGGVLVDNFAPRFKALAKQKRTVYVSDVLNNLLGNQAFMSDRVHPNDAGYAIIAERVFQALRPVLH